MRFVMVMPDDSEARADGLGKQVCTVISVHKPGKYPSRVFYTRAWTDPDGKSFGKTALRIKTLQAFRRLVRGYMHEYELEAKPLPEPGKREPLPAHEPAVEELSF